MGWFRGFVLRHASISRVCGSRDYIVWCLGVRAEKAGFTRGPVLSPTERIPTGLAGWLLGAHWIWRTGTFPIVADMLMLGRCRA